jgi:hypothetical protein
MSTDPVTGAAGDETVDSPPHLLLADGSDTAGAFSIIRADLRPGRDGAAPPSHIDFRTAFEISDLGIDDLRAARRVAARHQDLKIGMTDAVNSVLAGRSTKW